MELLSPQAFPKSYRLLTASDFSYLKINSQKFKTPSLMVFYRPSQKALSHARLGLSVSKKVGKAHRRNRLKRISREWFRKSTLKNFSFDIMVVVSSYLDRSNPTEAESDAQLIHSLNKLESYLKRRL